jgi:hypothetical protein
MPGSSPPAGEVLQKQHLIDTNQTSGVSQRQHMKHEKTNSIISNCGEDINYRIINHSGTDGNNNKTLSLLHQAVPGFSQSGNVFKGYRGSVSMEVNAPILSNRNTERQENLSQVMLIYMYLNERKKLAELTGHGLTVSAARDILKQEKEVEAIQQLIKKKHILNQQQSGHNERKVA